ncbi:MAG: choice-of-anchor D domain-containing protein [Nitrospirota bacterium]
MNDIYTCSSGYSGILYETTTFEYNSYIQNGEDGLLFAGCQYDEGVFEDKGAHLVFIPPQMQIGETVSSYVPSMAFFDVTLVGIETITVPAGTFTTLNIEAMIHHDDGSCSYKTNLWLAKGIGPVKMHRTDANPADCLGCAFVCDPDNDLSKLNAPAELISFSSTQGASGKPKISVSPKSVNFGPLRVGSISDPVTVTIANTGKADLFVNSITITGTNAAEFSQTNDCSIIPAKSSCPIAVRFAPALPFGKKNAIMSVSSNDLRKPTVNVNLSGKAAPPKISVSPKSVNFGSVPVGSASSRPVTIRNTGISDLEVNTIAITGTDAAEFSQTNDCSTVPNDSLCTVNITFSPASAGSKSATMTISSNDPKKAAVNVRLSSGDNSSGGGGKECPDISGEWDYENSGTVTCTYGGDSETEHVSGSGAIFITQDGCKISWTEPTFDVSRSGTVTGNSVEVSGKFVVPLVGGVDLTQNTYSATGTISQDKETINLSGSGQANGSYQGISFSCTGTDEAVFTRPVYGLMRGLRGQHEVAKKPVQPFWNSILRMFTTASFLGD